MPRQLCDILVEEISIVDKAANRFNFFLIKREGEERMDFEKFVGTLEESFGESLQERLEKESAEDVFKDSLDILSKYYEELPEEAQQALGTLVLSLTKQEDKDEDEEEEDNEDNEDTDKKKKKPKDEDEDEEDEDGEEEEEEEDEEDEDEDEIDEKGLEAISGKLALLEEKLKNLDKPSDFNLDALDESTLDKIKEQHSLFSEEEVADLVAEHLKEHYEGE